MNRCVLACDGATVGTTWIPAFEMKAGDLVCLHMPCLSDSDESARVVEALLGAAPVPGLHLFGRITLASPPMHRRGLLGLLCHPRAAEWFRRITGATRQAASAAVARVGQLTDDRVTRLRIGRIPWDARVLLGLEAAWAPRPDAVIFSTVGLAPLGVLQALDSVRAHLTDCAALYLSYEYFTQGRRERSCPAGAVCVGLTNESRSDIAPSPA